MDENHIKTLCENQNKNYSITWRVLWYLANTNALPPKKTSGQTSNIKKFKV